MRCLLKLGVPADDLSVLVRDLLHVNAVGFGASHPDRLHEAIVSQLLIQFILKIF